MAIIIGTTTVEVGAERREGTGPRAQTAQTKFGRTQWRRGEEERNEQ